VARSGAIELYRRGDRWARRRPYARAFAKRFDTPQPEPQIVSATAIVAEFGQWAKDYGLDQRLSGAKAWYDLG
jgi:hypothetical protein